ncbi:g4227 [Coccomyxa elongata]
MGGVSAAAQPMTSRAESGGSSEGGREAKADEREHRSAASIPKADAWKEKNRLAQRAFRQRQKEKQKASERHIEELSEKVQSLELEKRQLQAALEKASLAAKSSAEAEHKSPDDALAVALKLGEATVQLQLTVGQIKAMTLERMVQIWKTMVHKVGQYLPEAERSPGSVRFYRLEDLAFEARLLLWAMVEHNMRTLSDFIKCNMEDLSTPRVADHQYWVDMLARIHLSPNQKGALVAARRAMLANIGALLAEREQLGAKIRGIEDVEDTKDGVAMHFQELSDLCEKVRANVDAIHVCKCYYMSHAYREIFTPLQCARFMYYSYPHGMDMLSLMTCAAKEAGEPSTHTLLRAVQMPTADGSAAHKLSAIDWNQAKKVAFQ